MQGGGYRTLAQARSDGFVIKKSRFIGHGSPAESEREALDFLAATRQAHREASHNCWAYIIGRNEGVMRHSDDGEPSGTAGLPILEMIRARRVVNCCVVVTRYFGGVLLGAGGLARAYARGAAAAINAAGVLMMEDTVRFWAGMDYAIWERVQRYLADAPVRTEHVEYAATVTATLLVRQHEEVMVFNALREMTDGQVTLLPMDAFCHGWSEPAASI